MATLVDASFSPTQIGNMDTHIVAGLKKLGRDAAEHIAGTDAVGDVDVASGEDSSDRPVYYFSFLIDQDRARQRVGLVRTRLVQKLRDDLIALGDGHYPVVRILDRTDWNVIAHLRWRLCVSRFRRRADRDGG